MKKKMNKRDENVYIYIYMSYHITRPKCLSRWVKTDEDTQEIVPRRRIRAYMCVLVVFLRTAYYIEANWMARDPSFLVIIIISMINKGIDHNKHVRPFKRMKPLYIVRMYVCDKNGDASGDKIWQMLKQLHVIFKYHGNNSVETTRMKYLHIHL